MHLTGHQFLTALTIGAVVFALAALWPLSEWAVAGPRRTALVAAMAVICACVAIDTHALAFPALEPDSWRRSFAHALQWASLPLFIALPGAVCVACAQSLASAGLQARVARAVALVVSLLAVVVAPFGVIVGGCGLAGACF
jgi:hypothetical protein